ncbi:MAG: caspase family protein [Limnospira sp.]
MGLKRREFLQRSGVALAALGMGETAWWQLSDRYRRALADPTGRKLALLVGINKYPTAETRTVKPLSGCVTDVELQRELLISRFGFQATDILTLTDNKATRENIEAGFTDHLIQQARPGDLVVFHFSGYGSSLPPRNPASKGASVRHSLIPVDVTLADDEPLNDLMEDTLWLLLRSLPTGNVVTVLDTSYAYPGHPRQGLLRVRSAAGPATGTIGEAERDSLAQLLDRNSLAPEQLEQRRPGELPGLVLSAAKSSQVATETTWGGFSAGLFTYALTQTLWNVTAASDLKDSLGRVAGGVERVTGLSQQPQLRQKLPAPDSKESGISALPLKSPPADGTITAVEDGGKTARLLLAGLPPAVLKADTVNSLFTVISEPPATPENLRPRLQIRSRNGLRATAELQLLESLGLPTPPIQPRQLVREAIRIVPRNVSLKIGLDPKLDRIERVDATSAFSTIPEVSIAGEEQFIDYLLSRVRDTTIAQSPTAPLMSLFQGHYGLFSAGQVLIPDTAGEGGEAVKVAVGRLIPHLKTRLATKLLQLTENDRSRLIRAKVTLAMLSPQARAVAKRETPQTDGGGGSGSMAIAGTLTGSATARSENFGIPTLPADSRIQMQLQNNGDLPLYFILFLLDTRGQPYVYDATLPPVSMSEESADTLPRQQRVEPGKTLNIPPTSSLNSDASPDMLLGELVRGPAGLTETYVIVSHYPFTQTVKAIGRGLKDSGNPRKFRLQFLANPLEVSRAVLEDLARASQLGVKRSGISTDNLALDVNAWATFNFICRVI